MTRIVYITIVSACVIEYWVKAKVALFSISRLEFSLLYLPHTFDSFYTLPHQRYRPSSFSMERPLSKYFNQFYFHRKRGFKTKTRKPRTDIGKLEKVGPGQWRTFGPRRTQVLSDLSHFCRIWPSDRHTSRSLLYIYLGLGFVFCPSLTSLVTVWTPKL